MMKRLVRLMRLSILALLLTAFSPALPMLAANPSITSTTITYATPSLTTNTITINGNNFNPKGVAPTVVLNGTTLTLNPGSTDTQIVATFSSSLPPGSFHLQMGQRLSWLSEPHRQQIVLSAPNKTQAFGLQEIC
jgi:hypothetical protein